MIFPFFFYKNLPQVCQFSPNSIYFHILFHAPPCELFIELLTQLPATMTASSVNDKNNNHNSRCQISAWAWAWAVSRPVYQWFYE